MTNEERSKLRREALKVEQEKTYNDKLKKKIYKKAAAIATAIAVLGGSGVYAAVSIFNNDDTAVADTTVEDTKEIPNDNYYIESETKNKK